MGTDFVTMTPQRVNECRQVLAEHARREGEHGCPAGCNDIAPCRLYREARARLVSIGEIQVDDQ